jgi:hypothetical protein
MKKEHFYNSTIILWVITDAVLSRKDKENCNVKTLWTWCLCGEKSALLLNAILIFGAFTTKPQRARSQLL